jgi:hypothetical protein
LLSQLGCLIDKSNLYVTYTYFRLEEFYL